MEAVQVRPPVPPDGAVQGRQTTADFVECYVMHYRRLVRALRLGGADEATAEDLAQEAFARALARWRRVSKGANPPGYVYRTGFRLLQRSRRRSGLEAPPASEPGTPGTRRAPGPPATPGADTTAAALVDFEAALDQMPPRRRACAVMCMVVGMSVAEAGDALGIADGTVRKHLEEARSDLRGAWRTAE
jgi:RNA polymerase sigma-70 factor, ECF subfamily